jgi:hypothetical protein
LVVPGKLVKASSWNADMVVVVVLLVDVVVVGQGFGEQVPAPSFIPPSAVHCAALSTTQAKAPIGDDGMQHWIGASVVVVVLLVVDVVLDVVVELVVLVVVELVVVVVELVVLVVELFVLVVELVVLVVELVVLVVELVVLVWWCFVVELLVLVVELVVLVVAAVLLVVELVVVEVEVVVAPTGQPGRPGSPVQVHCIALHWLITLSTQLLAGWGPHAALISSLQAVFLSHLPLLSAIAE